MTDVMFILAIKLVIQTFSKLITALLMFAVNKTILSITLPYKAPIDVIFIDETFGYMIFLI